MKLEANSIPFTDSSHPDFSLSRPMELTVMNRDWLVMNATRLLRNTPSSRSKPSLAHCVWNDWKVFIAARLATPYTGGGPHRKVRDQFWYTPELAIIVMRCLPPKLDLLVVEHLLRKILQAPAGEQDLVGTAIGLPADYYVGEPPLAEGIMGLIEDEDSDDTKA
jgi:hypothetical protein